MRQELTKEIARGDLVNNNYKTFCLHAYQYQPIPLFGGCFVYQPYECLQPYQLMLSGHLSIQIIIHIPGCHTGF